MLRLINLFRLLMLGAVFDNPTVLARSLKCKVDEAIVCLSNKECVSIKGSESLNELTINLNLDTKSVEAFSNSGVSVTQVSRFIETNENIKIFGNSSRILFPSKKDNWQMILRKSNNSINVTSYRKGNKIELFSVCEENKHEV